MNIKHNNYITSLYFCKYLNIINIIFYKILTVIKRSNIVMVFNIHISVKSGKSVFSAISNELFMA